MVVAFSKGLLHQWGLKYLRDIHSWFYKEPFSFKKLSVIHKYWFESPKSEKSIQIQPTQILDWVYWVSVVYDESAKGLNGRGKIIGY